MCLCLCVCVYRSSLLSQRLGFNTSNLSSLDINITAPGKMFPYVTEVAVHFHNMLLYIPSPLLYLPEFTPNAAFPTTQIILLTAGSVVF